MKSKKDKPSSFGRFFDKFSTRVTKASGKPGAFIIACVLIILWAVTGPIFKFSDTWQLVINTSTTIVTFLMVFLIQNTQNRDALAMHLKLDELIRAVDAADNQLMAAEDETDEELAELKAKYQALCDEHAELKGHYERIKGSLNRNGRAEVPAAR